MTTLVFGARGFLGEKFLQHVDASNGSEVDIVDVSQVVAELDRFQPSVVINCAGKTGRPNIDWCEQHRRETTRSNVTGPLVLLEECLRRGLYLVHIGSGCLYEGDNNGRGFSEDDVPNFLGSFYSKTKMWSDQILSQFPVLILRIRMPFDDSLHPRSLIGKLVHYRDILDAPNSVTYIPDFLHAAKRLIENRHHGIFNIVNPGSVSPVQIMQRYTKLVDPRHRFSRILPEQLNAVTKAKRSNCLLSTEKLHRAGIQLRPVAEAVDLALESIARRQKVTLPTEPGSTSGLNLDVR